MTYKELYFPWDTFNREEEINKAIKGATYVKMAKKEALNAQGCYNITLFVFYPEEPIKALNKFLNYFRKTKILTA